MLENKYDMNLSNDEFHDGKMPSYNKGIEKFKDGYKISKCLKEHFRKMVKEDAG